MLAKRGRIDVDGHVRERQAHPHQVVWGHGAEEGDVEVDPAGVEGEDGPRRRVEERGLGRNGWLRTVKVNLRVAKEDVALAVDVDHPRPAKMIALCAPRVREDRKSVV